MTMNKETEGPRTASKVVRNLLAKRWSREGFQQTWKVPEGIASPGDQALEVINVLK